jgi:hypothetical protein
VSKAAALWLEQNTNEDDIVGHLGDADFVFLFFWNTKNHYLYSFDKIFLYQKNKTLFDDLASFRKVPEPTAPLSWFDTNECKPEVCTDKKPLDELGIKLHKVMTETIGAKYFFFLNVEVSKCFLDSLKHSKIFKVEYEDNINTVLKAI